ncbi:hypothetical protein GCM10009555_038150 [Acrocarpospora macrocephala]|uniref:Uncharacterized protein n=1 Tax=Acrocarpospora macrocephala TaxID=150177 RepID=A0A5M3WQY6_9ACTN|nr:hypothetical protein [Acrocarpospora macrocephala]GES09701.1 hypothetical protein Amac_032970 [Acrocarpospora macrocephala]
MSFVLAVWRESEPIGRAVARERYSHAEGSMLKERFPDEDVSGGLIRIAADRVDEVSNAVFAFARDEGLVCYDPQRDLVHNREPLGAYTGIQLHSGDGMVVTDPDLGLIHDVLGTMSVQNPFVALVVYGRHFMQVSPGSAGDYELEFKEGGVIRATRLDDLTEVRACFLAYATGDRSFLGEHQWSAEA